MKSDFNFKDKKVLVMGLGLHGGGAAVAKWFCRRGAKVLVTDLKTRAELKRSLDKLKGLPIKYVLGQHRISDFKKTELVVQNPGVPRESKFLKAAREEGIPVENEASLFFNLCPASIVGITGTKGKSTVLTLVYRIMKRANPKTLMAGNIGQKAMLEIIDKVKKNTPVVLELSSWHLEGLASHQMSPHWALVTNIKPDHLNRYQGMRDYIKAKEIIFKYQKPRDSVVLNYDDPILRKLGRKAKSRTYWFSKKPLLEKDGAFVKNGWIVFKEAGRTTKICETRKIKLKGEHNLANILAAATVTMILKIKPAILRQVIVNFKGLPNRLELVRKWRGRELYNDTTSTNPAATLASLSAFKKKVILIAGGVDKKLDYGELVQQIKTKVNFLVLLPGTATDKLVANLKKFKSHYRVVRGMKEAVKLAVAKSSGGDIILLSPGAASFNLFVNEFDRGDQFKKYVKALKS